MAGKHQSWIGGTASEAEYVEQAGQEPPYMPGSREDRAGAEGRAGFFAGLTQVDNPYWDDFLAGEGSANYPCAVAWSRGQAAAGNFGIGLTTFQACE